MELAVKETLESSFSPMWVESLRLKPVRFLSSICVVFESKLVNERERGRV